MGVRGIRPNKRQGKEPELITDVKGIIKEAKEKGFIKNDYTDIEKIIESLNISIEYSDNLDPSESGYLQCNDGQWIIGVNKKHHRNRQRFTMAHELAHYYLHRDAAQSFKDTTFFRNDNFTSIEYAANEFASILLMPENSVRQEIDNGTFSLIELSKNFGVSIDAMRNRVKSLGYNIRSNE